MAISRNRELKCIEYHIDRNSVDVAWKDQIIEDGHVIHESIHRGAFPVDNSGQLSAEDQASIGTPLVTLIGNAGATAVLTLNLEQSKVAQLQAGLEQTQQDLATAQQESVDLQAQLTEAQSEIAELQTLLTAAHQQIVDLQNQLAQSSPAEQV